MRNLLDCLMTNRLIPNNKKMALQNSHNVTARLKKLSRPRPTLATVLGSGFHHTLTELRVEKSPLHGGIDWIKVVP